MSEFLIPNGVEINGEVIRRVPIAETTGEAEEIFTKKPADTKLYTWFAEVLSVAIRSIGDEPISDEFLKDKNRIRKIHKYISSIDFVDAGSLILQVHRACWEDVISDQNIICQHCGHSFKDNVDLNKIEVPFDESKEKVSIVKVRLLKDYVVPKLELFQDMEGMLYNTLTFRIPSLGDAIRNEGLAKNEIEFWRKICFDTLIEISYTDETGAEIELPKKFLSGRGSLLFKKDLSSKELKHVRKTVQTATPSVKLYYENPCPNCRKDTPFYANVNAFFLA